MVTCWNFGVTAVVVLMRPTSGAFRQSASVEERVYFFVVLRGRQRSSFTMCSISTKSSPDCSPVSADSAWWASAIKAIAAKIGCGIPPNLTINNGFKSCIPQPNNTPHFGCQRFSDLDLIKIRLSIIPVSLTRDALERNQYVCIQLD